MSEIDPVQFGALTAQVSAQGKEIAELRLDVKNLLELANKSKGGFWMGMAIASSLGGLAGFVMDHFIRR
jgi:hypothetical protein